MDRSRCEGQEDAWPGTGVAQISGSHDESVFNMQGIECIISHMPLGRHYGKYRIFHPLNSRFHSSGEVH